MAELRLTLRSFNHLERQNTAASARVFVLPAFSGRSPNTQTLQRLGRFLGVQMPEHVVVLKRVLPCLVIARSKSLIRFKH